MRRRYLIVLCLALAGASAAGTAWYSRGTPADPRLARFRQALPPVPVVFTSRSEPASLIAAAPDGEEFHYPGKRLWQAHEGRLRLLMPQGDVYELTWGKRLSDGSTLIDVMSPAVTPDGQRVVFAGRKGGDDPGHFRLYEIKLNGSGLRQLTGLAPDAGCVASPPMRYAEAGEQILADEQRRRIDYDDVDPVAMGDGQIVFASSRQPDLGRDHARRATNLWIRRLDGELEQLSGNRNNDRWPWLTPTDLIVFSHWSRNREVISADGRDIVPWQPGMESLTQSVNAWMGAAMQFDGGRFGHLAKLPIPVWRPRTLFNGRLVFMTSMASTSDDDVPAELTIVQVEPTTIANAPSALAAGSQLPRQEQDLIQFGPRHDEQGRVLQLATPSPCPDSKILAAGRVGDVSDSPAEWGIYLLDDNWSAMQVLFDDPELVDAEPVAVYSRPINSLTWKLPPVSEPRDHINLADDSEYRGPTAFLDAGNVYRQENLDSPGQLTDAGNGPIFAAPPAGTIDHLRVYAAERDRFDDPHIPRIHGAWKLLLKSPLEGDRVGFWVPAGVPTVLAGFDAQGRVVEWQSAAADSAGTQARFYAYAGDHYSAATPDTYSFCLGCHTGHNGIGHGRGSLDLRERLEERRAPSLLGASR